MAIAVFKDDTAFIAKFATASAFNELAPINLLDHCPATRASFPFLHKGKLLELYVLRSDMLFAQRKPPMLGSPALNAVFLVAFFARKNCVAPFDSHCIAAVRGGTPKDVWQPT